MTKSTHYKHIDKVFAFVAKINFKTGFVAAMCCLLFLGCSKKQTAAQGELPQAIKELIAASANIPDCNCHPCINLYNWRNEDVYVYTSNDELNWQDGYICDGIPLFFDLNGQEFTLEAGYYYDNFLKDSHLAREVWVCK